MSFLSEFWRGQSRRLRDDSFLPFGLLDHGLQAVQEIRCALRMGGGIDPGESPLTALHREVFEETGWRIARPRRLGCFRRFTFMPEYDLWAEKICTIYLATPVRPLAAPTEPDHMALWMAPEDAARKLGNAGDRSFVARFAVQ